MRRKNFIAIVMVLTMSLGVVSTGADTSGESLQPTVVPIPGGEGGIGFDDMIFSSSLHKVIVPAERTGKIFLCCMWVRIIFV